MKLLTSQFETLRAIGAEGCALRELGAKLGIPRSSAGHRAMKLRAAGLVELRQGRLLLTDAGLRETVRAGMVTP